VTGRDRIVVLVVAAFAAVAGFYMLALKPKRQEAGKLGTEVSAARERLDEAEQRLAVARQARASYSLNYATVARLGKAVPTDDDVPSLVYQLDSTAGATGVDFRSVKLTSGSGAQPSAGSAASAAASTSDGANKQAESGDSGKTDGGEKGESEKGQSGQGAQATPNASSPAPPTQAATASLPPGAVVGPAGLSTMPFSFTFEGNFFRLSDFLTRIERYISPRQRAVDVRGRLLLVNGISLTAAQSGFPRMKAAISAQAYLLPAGQGLFNGASPQAPGGAGQTQPAGATNPAPPTAPATVGAK
jgi:hypothetical protein